jgi:DNA-binding response OmpR family regulator
MKTMHIAILEDEYILALHTQDLLLQAEHTVEIFTTGNALLKALQRDTFDLLILDWNVPDISGIKVLRHVREELHSKVPVLFLTSRQFEQEIVQALSSGADDYCAKPVRENEFMARVAALGRRAYNPDTPNSPTHTLGGYTFNRLDNTVHWVSQGQAQHAKLSEKEFNLALFLFENIGRSLSRKRLMTHIWGRDDDACSRTLDVHISQIRTKLDLSATSKLLRLKAIHGFGYRIITAESTTDA